MPTKTGANVTFMMLPYIKWYKNVTFLLPMKASKECKRNTYNVSLPTVLEDLPKNKVKMSQLQSRLTANLTFIMQAFCKCHNSIYNEGLPKWWKRPTLNVPVMST